MRFHPLILLVAPFLLLAGSCGKQPDLLWKFKTNGYIYSSPVIAGANVLIGSTDGNLYALNAKTGAKAWQVRLGNRIYSNPLLHEGSIYIGSDTGDFYSIDPAKGAIRWRFHTKEMIDYAACADDSGVYFGSRDAGFYKLAFDGSRLWDFRAGYRFGGHCSFYKNLVFSASWDNHLYALDRSTGSQQWKFSTGKINYGGVAVDADDVYLTSHNVLYRFRAQDGTLLNQAKLGEVSEVLFWRDFLWTVDGGLRKWSRDLKEQGFLKARTSTGFMPLAGADYIVVGGSNELTAISPDLKIVWRYKTDDDFWAPGVIHDNVYYTGNRDTYVYALRLP